MRARAHAHTAMEEVEGLSAKLSECVNNMWKESHNSCINFLMNGRGSKKPAASFFNASKTLQRLFKEVEASIQANYPDSDFTTTMTMHMTEGFVAALDQNRPTFSERDKPMDAVATKMVTRFPSYALRLLENLANDQQPSDANDEEYEILKKQLESETLKRAGGDINKAKLHMTAHLGVIFELYLSPELSDLIDADDDNEEEQKIAYRAEEEAFVTEREEDDTQPTNFTANDMEIIMRTIKAMERSMQSMKAKKSSSSNSVEEKKRKISDDDSEAATNQDKRAKH